MKQKILLMFVLLMTAVTGAMATEYISDLILIGSGDSAPKVKQQYVDQGWKDTDYNLNKGCGSSATNIYLLYKTSTNKADAITGFYIQCGSSTRSDTQVKDGRTYYSVQGEYDDNLANSSNSVPISPTKAVTLLGIMLLKRTTSGASAIGNIATLSMRIMTMKKKRPSQAASMVMVTPLAVSASTRSLLPNWNVGRRYKKSILTILNIHQAIQISLIIGRKS